MTTEVQLEFRVTSDAVESVFLGVVDRINTGTLVAVNCPGLKAMAVNFNGTWYVPADLRQTEALATEWERAAQ